LDAFTHWVIISLETISDILSRAILNINQLNDETKHSRDISMVVDIEKELTSELDSDDIIKRSVDLIHDGLNFYNVEFYTIDDDNYDLVMFASKGPFKKKIPIGFRQNIDSGIIGKAYNQRKAIVVNDVSPFSSYLETIGKNILAAIATPIVAKGEILGILNIESNEQGAFNEWDYLVINAISELLAGALARANRYKEQQMKDLQIRMAMEIGDDLNRITSVNKLLEMAARLIRKRLNLPHVGLYTIVEDTDELDIRALKGSLKKGMKVGTKVSSKEGLIGWCLTGGEDAMVNDTTVDHRCIGLKGTEAKSEMVVLVRIDDKAFGVIDAKSKRFDSFSDWDFGALKAIVKQVENVLWHLQRFENKENKG